MVVLIHQHSVVDPLYAAMKDISSAISDCCNKLIVPSVSKIEDTSGVIPTLRHKVLELQTIT